MAKEHPLIATRRVLNAAVEEQLKLAENARDNARVPGMREIEANATAEAGRLVNRLMRVQEEIELHDLD